MDAKDMEIKPNSHKYKQEQIEKNKKKEITPVTKNKAIKKKNIGRKVTDSLIGEELGKVKSYIIMDVLIPAAKKAISDIVTNGIDMLLYGETGGRNRRRSGISNVSYTKYYDRYNDRDDRYRTPNRTRNRYSYDDVIIETRAEAEDVLTRMDELIDTYGVVSVADLYDLVGVTGNYTDNKFGWTTMGNSSVVRVRDGYVLHLPKAYPID